MEWAKLFESPTHMTVMLVILIALWKALDLATIAIKDKLGLKSTDGLAMERFAVTCSAHPDHFNEVSNANVNASRSRDLLEKWDDKINQGFFSCNFKDRDEVIGLINAIKDNTKAVTELTRTMRNGGR